MVLQYAAQMHSTFNIKITSVDPELEEQVELSVDGELSRRED